MGGKLVGQVTQEISLEKNFYESHFEKFLTKAVESYTVKNWAEDQINGLEDDHENN